MLSRIAQGWPSKVLWVAVGIAVFWAAYVAGTSVAPILSAFIHLFAAIFKVFGKLLP
jgi:uncharacterized membrane protein